jgi:hypothetical protein
MFFVGDDHFEQWMVFGQAKNCYRNTGKRGKSCKVNISFDMKSCL